MQREESMYWNVRQRIAGTVAVLGLVLTLAACSGGGGGGGGGGGCGGGGGGGSTDYGDFSLATLNVTEVDAPLARRIASFPNNIHWVVGTTGATSLSAEVKLVALMDDLLEARTYTAV